MADPSKFKCVDLTDNDLESFKNQLQKHNKVPEHLFDNMWRSLSFKEVIEIIDTSIYDGYNRNVEETCRSCPPTPHTG